MADAEQSQEPTSPSPTADDDVWMTTFEVAEEWGRNVETVRRWIRDGNLPARRTPGGRTLLVRRSDVLASLERGRVENERQPKQNADDAQALALPGERTILIG